MSTIITAIDRHSPAERAGVQVGEQLLSINGHPIVDVLDYRFYGYDPLSHLELKTVAGNVRHVTCRKAEGQDLGLNFDTYLMDEMRSCANHCLFCFVDQMPPGMRSTLYFKDDDARLSFLLGNYITLTNLTEREAQRIIDLHISPINVSVHATDPQLHCTMLGNKNAARSLDYIQAFCKAGIVMNGQIVVCPGWNDGDQLRRTLRDLTEWQFSSCSLVPVGITKYRQGLAKLRPVDRDCARDIIAIAEEFGLENLRRFGTRRFFCADELFLRAGLELPQEDYYEGYRQLENGVGMMRLFEDEFRAELDRPHRIYGTKQIDVVTGTMAGPLITGLMDELHRQYPMIDVKVHVVKNNFFGGNVGVAGLVTATDIIAQCEGKLKSGTLGIPAVMLREEKDTFLDDMTIAQLGERLGVKVEVLPVGGGDEAKALLRTGLHISRRRA